MNATPSGQPAAQSSNEHLTRPTGAWGFVQVLAALGAASSLAASAAFAKARPGGSSSLLSDEMTIWGFLAAFASATVLLVLMTRKARQTRFVEALFMVAVFTGIGSVLMALFGRGAAVVGTSAAVFLYYGSRSVAVFDVLLLLGCAGVAANLGTAMRPYVAAILLAVLAVYDIVGAYVTKHVTEMTDTMLRRKTFFAMIVAERPSDLLLPVKSVGRGTGFTFFGIGDLILPAMLVASAAVTDPRAAVFTGLGALLGTATLHVLFQPRPERVTMPALPPIAVGALVFFLADLLLTA